MKILLLVFALWSLIDPSDGSVIKRNLGNCPKNGYRTFAIECEDWCRIRLARANFKKGGRITVIGRAGWRSAFTQKNPKCGRKCFCRGVSKKRNAVTCKRHEGKKIKSRQVHFDIRCKKLTKKLKFTVNVINLKKHQKKSGVLVMDIGDMVLDEMKFFKITCNGKCNLKNSKENIYISKGSGGMSIYASKSFLHYEIVNRDFEICSGTTSGGRRVHCIKGTEVPDNSFSFLVEAETPNTDVKLHLRIDNLLRIEPFTPAKVCSCTGSQMTGACDKYGRCLCNPGHSGKNCTPDK